MLSFIYGIHTRCSFSFFSLVASHFYRMLHRAMSALQLGKGIQPFRECRGALPTKCWAGLLFFYLTLISHFYRPHIFGLPGIPVEPLPPGPLTRGHPHEVPVTFPTLAMRSLCHGNKEHHVSAPGPRVAEIRKFGTRARYERR